MAARDGSAVPDDILALPGQDDSDDEATTPTDETSTEDEGDAEEADPEAEGGDDGEGGSSEDGDNDGQEGDEPAKAGIPKAAFHRVKDENQRLKAELARLQSQPPAPPPPPPAPVIDDPEPDPDDPMAHLKWQRREMDRRTAALEAKYEADRLRDKEAAFQAAEGPDWDRRVAHFLEMVKDMPHLVAQVKAHADPIAEMIRLTDKYGFTKSSGEAAPKQPAAPKKPATPPPPNRPKTLTGAAGGRSVVDDPSAEDDMTDEEWEALPEAKRQRLLGRR
jgi:hypothetical protein